MPECHVCAGTEFEELDGLFYCLVCQTQSQNIQTVELDETDAVLPAPGVLREVKKKKTSHDSKFVNEFEKGRPWTLYEAYQIIMQAQVDALILHGADPDLKEAVLRLWAKYLSQLGVAFIDDIRLLAKNVEKGSRHREKYMGNCENPVTTPVRWKQSTETSIPMSKLARKKEEQVKASEVLHGETVCVEDNLPMSDSDSSLDSCSSWELLYEDDEEKKSSQKESHNQEHSKNKYVCKRQRKERYLQLSKIAYQAEFMDLYKTVVFCYLGLLFTSPGITVSDVIKWVYDGSFPYLEVTHLLPSDLKLFCYDEHLFHPSHMTSTKLRLLSGKVARFLGIKKLPAFPTKYVISRYILQLDLPVEMINLVHYLCEKAPPELACTHNAKHATREVSVKNFDAQCVAYIIVMLKLLFGVNDSKERQLSEYTRRVKTDLQLGEELFEWDAWQAHANHKFFIKSQSPWDKSDYSATPDIELTCRAFKTAGCKDKTFSSIHLYNRTKKRKVQHYKLENRELLKRPLDVLLNRWTQRDQRAAQLRQNLIDSEDDKASSSEEECKSFSWKNSCINAENVMNDKEMGTRFQRSTLCHITQAKDFWHRKIAHEDLGVGRLKAKEEMGDKQRLDDENIWSSCDGSFSGQDGTEESYATTFHRVKTETLSFHGASAVQPTENDAVISQLHESSSSVKSQMSEIELYSYVFEMLDDLLPANRFYLLQPKPEVYATESLKETERANEYLKYPVTYSWLLTICSRVVCCPVEEIQNIVFAIENYLL